MSRKPNKPCRISIAIEEHYERKIEQICARMFTTKSKLGRTLFLNWLKRQESKRSIPERVSLIEAIEGARQEAREEQLERGRITRWLVKALDSIWRERTV